MMQAYIGAVPTMFYRIQPGDGTEYKFSITRLADPMVHAWEEGKPMRLAGPAEADKMLIPGANGEYVLIAVHMESSAQGSYPFRIDQLDVLNPGFLFYASSHMRKLDMYTTCAVMLAARVLVHEPFSVEKAAEAMLQTPEWMKKL